MKKASKKDFIILAIILVIIVAGISITLTVGLNFDLKFQATKKVELYLNQVFDVKDIKQITDETIGKDVIVQKIEVYEDSVSIISKDITEEQKTNLINKVNEKYGTEINPEEVEIISVPKTRGRDIIKPYIAPFAISTVAILAYMAVRYRKLGSVKVILDTLELVIASQVILLGIIAITRIPVGRLTIPMVITVYIIALIALTRVFEKCRIGDISSYNNKKK